MGSVAAPHLPGLHDNPVEVQLAHPAHVPPHPRRLGHAAWPAMESATFNRIQINIELIPFLT